MAFPLRDRSFAIEIGDHGTQGGLLVIPKWFDGILAVPKGISLKVCELIPKTIHLDGSPVLIFEGRAGIVD
ncbi:hypothetical protein [Kiloniella litopenaei]|uniref:hypothetical protein n=1 Tax=Kiloniella litopenaei TaxID=1549748 RepID=UPI001FE16A8C|nr:hypothetical protein [Kiloniella litopenaei]